MSSLPTEPVWNGLITCDYEESRPEATPLAWELSTRSVTLWPFILMDEPAFYGVLRRPGIVDVPHHEHQRLVGLWHRRLADPVFVTRLRERVHADRETTEQALRRGAEAAERADVSELAAALAQATAALLRYSATHIVNWLLPEAHWRQLLTDLLGDPGQAEACLLALQLPDRPGVILSKTDDAHVRRQAAVQARDTWRATVTAAAADRAGRDSALHAEVTAMVAALAWAADCEERRHELRATYLALVDAWCTATGADPTTITIDDLLKPPTRAVPLREATDTALYGGKAVQLARLLAAGLPIADGLVIPASLPDTELGQVVHTILAQPLARHPYGLICRSSAPGEDGPNASFAGLHTSRFTPAQPLPLLAALTAVRASATTAAVRDYAHVHGQPSPDAIAIIIQSALRPYAAGVLAAHRPPADHHPTDHDQTGHERTVPSPAARWRIEAVHGLAGPLVEGSVTGEVHHSDTECPVRPAIQPDVLLPATQAELVVPPGEWVPVVHRDGTTTPMKIRTSVDGLLYLRRPRDHTAVLTPADVKRLLALAAKTAHVLGLDRIDMEWVMALDGTIIIVQARPLTRPLPNQQTTPTRVDNGAWEGIAAASGQASGRALLLHPQLRPEDIAGTVLVCDNLGAHLISALTHRPAAIAATRGGPLSHAATLARELQIPCVTALPAQLPDAIAGSWVTVDGDAGTVHLS